MREITLRNKMHIHIYEKEMHNNILNLENRFYFYVLARE